MENILIIAASLITAIMLGRIIIPNILIISLRKRLFDVPDARKVHKRPIPRLGGVTFFPVIVFTVCAFTSARLLTGQMAPGELNINMVSELLLLIAGLTLLYIIGIADDMIGVRYRKKIPCTDYFGSIIPCIRTVHQQLLWTIRYIRSYTSYWHPSYYLTHCFYYECHQLD